VSADTWHTLDRCSEWVLVQVLDADSLGVFARAPGSPTNPSSPVVLTLFHSELEGRILLQFIGVPTSAGAYGAGQERAPGAFRAAGLMERLAGVAIDGGDVEGVRFSPDPRRRTSQNLEAVIRVIRTVRDRVSEVLTQGDLPVVLGGDCTITLGVIAACTRVDPDAVLAYFDGDVDLSTPVTTSSGILDAMGMAHILDLEGADDDLASIGDRRPLMNGNRISLIGHEEHDLDDEQIRLLDQAGVHRFPAERLRADKEETIERALGVLGEQPRIVHFDIDAVDSTDCPLAEYPHFNTGVSLDVAEYVLARLFDTSSVQALVITEINPLKDPDDIYIPRLRDVLVRVLGHGRVD
jgi:arginase